MAWWDHEELKSHENRSDRYILAFPEKYTIAKVNAAKARKELWDLQDLYDRVEKATKEYLKT